jgi:hypothetical protein
MATITGPNDAPHGRVTITMERYEAEALARFVRTFSHIHALWREGVAFSIHDEEIREVIAALYRIDDEAN